MASPFGDAGAAKTSVDPFASSASRSRTSEATTTRAKNAVDATPRARAPAYRAWDDVEVFEVPETLRRDGAARNERFVEHVSLEGLFGATFADAFHDDASFRTDVRRAMRKDLFVPDENLSAEANAAAAASPSARRRLGRYSPRRCGARSTFWVMVRRWRRRAAPSKRWPRRDGRA